MVLKAETRSGLLQSWNQQKDHLFTICKVKETIFRHRLKLLQDLKLLRYDRHSIQLCSWESLGEALGCDTHEKFIVQYEISNSQRVQEWIIATEIKDNQNRQAYKILQKVNKNPEIKTAFIAAIIKAGGDSSKLSDVQYFLNWLLILYRSDFVQASEIHDLLVEIRPDTNRGVRGIAKAWTNEIDDPEAYSKKVKKLVTRIVYWKQILAKAGIVDISKLQIESTTRTRNKQCHVLWLPSCKNSPRKESYQTMLCLCDSIDVLTPWLYKYWDKDNTDNKYIPKINA